VLGPRGHDLGQAVASTGVRAAGGKPSIAHAASVAFVSGLNAILIVGCITVAVGALAAATLMRMRAPAAAPATQSR
jgi:hypothetical protein